MAVAAPLVPPLQLTLVTAVVALTGGDCATVVPDVEVQSLLVLVTNKLYVPGASTTGVSVVAPETILPLGVVHKYVKAGPCEEPVALSCTVELLQFRLAGAAMLAVGGVVF